MQLTIRITCDNAPFEDDPIGEIERVLKQLVFRLGEDRYAFQRGTSGKLLDSNGNSVGDFVLNVPRTNRTDGADSGDAEDLDCPPLPCPTETTTAEAIPGTSAGSLHWPELPVDDDP